MYLSPLDEDPNDGFTLLDGTALSENVLNIRTHTLITQVYGAMVADIKNHINGTLSR